MAKHLNYYSINIGPTHAVEAACLSDHEETHQYPTDIKVTGYPRT